MNPDFLFLPIIFFVDDKQQFSKPENPKQPQPQPTAEPKEEKEDFKNPDNTESNQPQPKKGKCTNPTNNFKFYQKR